MQKEKLFNVINKQSCLYLKPSKVKFKSPFWNRNKKRKQHPIPITKEGLIAILKEKDR